MSQAVLVNVIFTFFHVHKWKKSFGLLILTDLHTLGFLKHHLIIFERCLSFNLSLCICMSGCDIDFVVAITQRLGDRIS